MSQPEQMQRAAGRVVNVDLYLMQLFRSFFTILFMAAPYSSNLVLFWSCPPTAFTYPIHSTMQIVFPILLLCFDIKIHSQNLDVSLTTSRTNNGTRWNSHPYCFRPPCNQKNACAVPMTTCHLPSYALPCGSLWPHTCVCVHVVNICWWGYEYAWQLWIWGGPWMAIGLLLPRSDIAH